MWTINIIKRYFIIFINERHVPISAFHMTKLPSPRNLKKK